jgi:oxygen-independent coproporphyrinogen-3 oxidase
MEESIPAYVDALCREFELVSGSLTAPLTVHSVYFGGGTPSILPVRFIDKILTELGHRFNLTSQVEVTLEANPGTIDLEKLENIYKIGINRLSLGAQSNVPKELKLLGRIHTVEETKEALSNARKAGFDNINVDFIYGLPGQSKSSWQKTLDFALSIDPEHLSMYALTLDEYTPLAKDIASGRLPRLDDDRAADLYEMTMDILETAGYCQYEISNWAKRQNGVLKTCTHNLQYWHNRYYLGFGAGAHGYSSQYRTANVDSISDYIKKVCRDGKQEKFPFSPANESCQFIDEKTKLQEAMMVGLRLTFEGVARSHFIKQYQSDYYNLFRKQIDKLLAQELLEWVNGIPETIRLTRRGRLLGNQVFMQFVGE